MGPARMAAEEFPAPVQPRSTYREAATLVGLAGLGWLGLAGRLAWLAWLSTNGWLHWLAWLRISGGLGATEICTSIVV